MPSMQTLSSSPNERPCAGRQQARGRVPHALYGTIPHAPHALLPARGAAHRYPVAAAAAVAARCCASRRRPSARRPPPLTRTAAAASGAQPAAAATAGGGGGGGATPWRSVLGPESRLPNLYWQSLSPGSLRRLPGFTALPPTEGVVLGGEASYRYVRQGTPLWTQLHAGRLTSARLKEALGLRDFTAARRMGGGAHRPEPGVLAAYRHLTTQAPHQPPPQAPLEGGGGGEGQLLQGLDDPQHANEAARLAYNERLGAADGPGGWDGAEEAGWEEADKRRLSEVAALGAAGAAGAGRMRLLWGNLQEPAAVATLSVLFPEAQVEEVGLLCLADPAPWGVERGELPPMGSSPDALVTHLLPITRRDVQEARQALNGATGPAALRAAASALLRAALQRHTQRALAAWGGTAGEAAAAGGGSGSGAASGSGSGAASGSGSSGSSSGIGSGSGSSGGRVGGLPLHACGTSEALEWVVRQLGQQGPDAPYEGGPAGAGRGHGPEVDGAEGEGEEVLGWVRLREVAEVKNHCPFAYRGQRKARKKGVVLEYAVADRGPLRAVAPLWVPQLQAHMAAAGADSCLLLSRSASRGVTLFRVWRDDAYLSSALELVRELQAAHVAPRLPPGCDPWVGRAGWADLVDATVHGAGGAERLLATSVTPQVAGADGRAFLPLR